MGFLAGITNAVGTNAQNAVNKMLDLRTAGYRSMADMYMKLAQQYPGLAGEYLGGAKTLIGAATNPYDANLRKQAEALNNPGEPLQRVLNQHIDQQHHEITGQGPAPQEVKFKLPTQATDFGKSVGAPSLSLPEQFPGSKTGRELPAFDNSIQNAPQNAQTASPEPAGGAISAPPMSGSLPTQGMPQGQPGGLPAPPTMPGQEDMYITDPMYGRVQNPAYAAELERWKTYQEKLDAVTAMRQQMDALGSGTGGASNMFTFGHDPSTPLGQKLTNINRTQFLMGKALIEPKLGPSIDGHPSTLLGGDYYINETPVDMSTAHRATDHIVKGILPDGTAGYTWASADQKSGAPSVRVPKVTRTTVKDTNPTTLRQTTTQVTAEGGPPPQHGVQGVLNDLNKQGTGDNTSIIPSNMEIKAAGGAGEQRKLDAARNGMAQISHLSDLIEDPNNMVGAVIGRVALGVNKLGSGTLMNWVHNAMSGNTEQEQIANQRQFVDKVQSAMLAITHDPTTPAEVSARTITLMRAINGLELIAMSGSGNGITRLYMMLKDAMLNPTQSADLIKGHMEGLAGMFAGSQASIMQARGEGWNRLTPKEKAAFEKFKSATYFEDYTPTTPAGPPGSAPAMSPAAQKYLQKVKGASQPPNVQ